MMLSKGVSLFQQDLKFIFDTIDKHKNQQIRLDEIKQILSCGASPLEDEESTQLGTIEEENEELYDKIRSKMDKKKVSFE